MEELEAAGVSSDSRLGLRINPLVGGGAIAQLSTATAKSKFGIPLTNANRVQVLDSFREHTFLSGLMLHVGSTGMSVNTMTEGIAAVHELANQVDAACACAAGAGAGTGAGAEAGANGAGRIQFVDIGGGLNANTDCDERKVTFEGTQSAIECSK